MRLPTRHSLLIYYREITPVPESASPRSLCLCLCLCCPRSNALAIRGPARQLACLGRHYGVRCIHALDVSNLARCCSSLLLPSSFDSLQKVACPTDTVSTITGLVKNPQEVWKINAYWRKRSISGHPYIRDLRTTRPALDLQRNTLVLSSYGRRRARPRHKSSKQSLHSLAIRVKSCCFSSSLGAYHSLSSD